MAVLQEYKCPCCGGSIEFDAKKQNMKCPFCDTEFDIETLSKYNEELNDTQQDHMEWDSSAGQQWKEGETDGLCYYICNLCGGEIVCDSTTAAASCPYCNSPVIMQANLSGMLKPDIGIPFKYNKEAAISALTAHYSKKRLLPKVFADRNHIKEVKGLYVPFWLFDADADAKIRYRATRVRTWSDSNYIYTETSYFSVRRDGTLSFEKVPVDGSSKMQDELMESIEPFDISEAVDFNTAYLSGFLADKYDVDSDQSVERANQRIKKSTEDAFASTVVGYTTVVPEHTSIALTNGRAKYALLPVWILNTEWEGKKYTFAMNGQTGKMVGNLPLDRAAYARWLIGLTGVVGAITFGLSYLLWLM